MRKALSNKETRQILLRLAKLYFKYYTHLDSKEQQDILSGNSDQIIRFLEIEASDVQGKNFLRMGGIVFLTEDNYVTDTAIINLKTGECVTFVREASYAWSSTEKIDKLIRRLT